MNNIDKETWLFIAVYLVIALVGLAALLYPRAAPNTYTDPDSKLLATQIAIIGAEVDSLEIKIDMLSTALARQNVTKP